MQSSPNVQRAAIAAGIFRAVVAVSTICFVVAIRAPTETEAQLGRAFTDPNGQPLGGGEGYSQGAESYTVLVSAKAELLSALASASASDVVFVKDDVTIDLTGTWGIQIPAGVTLASGRGQNGSLGALLFTTTEAKERLLKVGGAGVRITGLRIRGPSTVIDRPDCGGTDASGISAETGSVADWFLEVDNCELSAWPDAAINLSHVAGVHVHHNHIHHNRRWERTPGCRSYGLGYGVVTNLGDALIEGNLFDHNRHDIASTGRPGSSYTARYNLSVEGLISHSFDMHGCHDRPDDAACVSNVDTAGTLVDIHDNVFLQRDKKAIVIRGVPEVGASASGNVFRHRNRAEAVYQRYVTGNLTVENNTYGIKKLTAWYLSSGAAAPWKFRQFSGIEPTSLGVGDFDGDGAQDLFRATGGRWYVARFGRQQWQQLNVSRFRVPKLGFGDFNGDGKTDVFRATNGKWHVSWAGQSKWVELNASNYEVSALRFGDFNGDSRADVLMLRSP